MQKQPEIADLELKASRLPVSDAHRLPRAEQLTVRFHKLLLQLTVCLGFISYHNEFHKFNNRSPEILLFDYCTTWMFVHFYLWSVEWRHNRLWGLQYRKVKLEIFNLSSGLIVGKLGWVITGFQLKNVVCSDILKLFYIEWLFLASLVYILWLVKVEVYVNLLGE